VTPAEIVLRRGESQLVVARVNGMAVGTVTFEVTEPVVSVDSTGLVRAITPGVGAIRYAVTGATTEPVIGVIPVLVRGVVIGADTLALVVGNQVRLRAVVVLAADRADTAVTWRSSDSTVATVTPEGLLTAVAAGQARLTAIAPADTLLQADLEVVVGNLLGGTSAARAVEARSPSPFGRYVRETHR
jgi:hypothetical protein